MLLSIAPIQYTSIYDRYKAKKADCDDGGLAASQVSFVTQIFFTLIPASVLLIFVPSYIFCYFEGWSYTISVYYCLETLMMIGLGDYIPTFQPDQAQKFGIYSLFYDIFVLIWLMFGLTYFLMLITLIAKGMQSKRMARLNEKLTKNILSTHNRIWHGVMNDVGFMRNLLTEAYVMKAEVSYADVFHYIILWFHWFIFHKEECWRNFEHRSASCPDLTMYSASRSLRQRKRSYSIHLCENIDNSISGLRPFNIKQIEEQSKSDPLLQMIDALATFEVRNAPQVTGINLFSDSDITMDERPAIARDPNYGWGRLMKHMGKFKSGTNDSMYRENDNRPMTSVMDVVNRVMKRRRYDLSSDAGHPINSEPSTSTQPMAEPLEKHATFSARRRFPRVALKRHAHSFPGRSLQNQAEYQATTIADLVRAIEAMHVKEQTEESLRDLSLNGADVPPAMLRTATTAFASGSRRNRMLSEPTSASKRWNRPQQHQIGNGGLDAGRKPLQGSHVHNIALETAIRAVHWRRHARHAQTAYVPTNFEKQN